MDDGSCNWSKDITYSKSGRLYDILYWKPVQNPCILTLMMKNPVSRSLYERIKEAIERAISDMEKNTEFCEEQVS